MPETKHPQPVYEAKRPAVDGKWVTYSRRGSFVDVHTHKTEYDARQALGLEGGSQDPRYQPGLRDV